MATIYVDIDGTLTKETEGFGSRTYRDRTPRKRIIAKINRMFAKGHDIIIWSSRWEMDRAVTMRWLRENKVRFHRLILDKPTFDVYICDKVINVENINGLKLNKG